MNYGPILFLGVFLSFALSWCGMILMPQLQIGRQSVVKATGDQLYPTGRAGIAEQGRQIYQSQGCVACHTQQVRPQDTPRWGIRHSVAQDYLLDQPVLFGSQRVGPDLSNVGSKLPDAKWHLEHLYNPLTKVKKSSMPPYRYLFERRKIVGEGSPNALKLEGAFAPEEGYEIVPKHSATALVAYLQSLRVQTSLFEAPIPQPKNTGETNAVPDAAATNAPSGDTNAPAATNAPAK